MNIIWATPSPVRSLATPQHIQSVRNQWEGKKKIHFSGQYRQKNTKYYPKKSFGQKVSSWVLAAAAAKSL